ncbi:unnamed protein product [Spirodela intermedia]|uniref:Uncharacterized protein n=1 Tax=Spirodela intermedia TaxID=51605 RepID=A0A7I8L7N2_SPIIN|nr:unnamed protein product [Spirodela intermedia]
MEVGLCQEASSSGPHNKRRFFITSKDLEIAHVVFVQGEPLRLKILNNY